MKAVKKRPACEEGVFRSIRLHPGREVWLLHNDPWMYTYNLIADQGTLGRTLVIPPGCEAWVGKFGLKGMEAVAGDRGLPWPPTRMSGGGTNLKWNKEKGKGRATRPQAKKGQGKGTGRATPLSKMNQKEKAKCLAQQKRTKAAKEAKLAKELGTSKDHYTEFQRLLVCSVRLAIGDAVMRFRQNHTCVAKKAMK